MKRSVSLLLFGAALSAAPITQVTLINAGYSAKSDGKHFVGPYTISLDGQNVPVLCIDFKDETQPGERWDAHVSPLGIDLGNTYYPAELTQYEEEAYLYTLMMESHADRVDIQHAAWAITDPDYLANAAAGRWIVAAQELCPMIKPADFKVVSEVSCHSGSRKQEFLTETLVPEPCLLNLVAGLFVMAIALVGRKGR